MNKKKIMCEELNAIVEWVLWINSYCLLVTSLNGKGISLILCGEVEGILICIADDNWLHVWGYLFVDFNVKVRLGSIEIKIWSVALKLKQCFKAVVAYATAHLDGKLFLKLCKL